MLLGYSIARMNGNRAEAEDALSTAMIRAAAAFEKPALRIDKPIAWFFRILRNACNDIHRDRSRRALALNGLRPEQRSYLGLQGAESRTPEDVARTNERHLHLARTITGMPEALKDAIHRRVINEEAYLDIADDLAISTALARKRVQLARNYLKTKLKS